MLLRLSFPVMECKMSVSFAWPSVAVARIVMKREAKGPHRYEAGQFFLIAYAATWIPWLVGVYLGRQPGMEAYAPLLNFAGATLFMVLTSDGCALKCDFKDRLLNLSRIKPLYALFALVMPFSVICLSIFLSLWLGESSDQFQLAGGAGLLPLIILALILAPIMEETGWHGYSVDSLRAYSGMMRTTLLFAVLWCASFGADSRHLSERRVQDAEQDLYREFLPQRHSCRDHRQLVLLQERPLDPGRHIVALDAECRRGADQCRTDRQMHRDTLLCGSSGKRCGVRSRAVRRRPPQFSRGKA